MATGVPLIFRIALLLALPLAFTYLISVAGLVLMWLRATWINLMLRRRRPQPEPGINPI